MLSPGMSAAVTTTTVDQSNAGSCSSATNRACGVGRADRGAVPGPRHDDVVGVHGRAGQLGGALAPGRRQPAGPTRGGRAGRDDERAGRLGTWTSCGLDDPPRTRSVPSERASTGGAHRSRPDPTRPPASVPWDTGIPSRTGHERVPFGGGRLYSRMPLARSPARSSSSSSSRSSGSHRGPWNCLRTHSSASSRRSSSRTSSSSSSRSRGRRSSRRRARAASAARRPQRPGRPPCGTRTGPVGGAAYPMGTGGVGTAAGGRGMAAVSAPPAETDADALTGLLTHAAWSRIVVDEEARIRRYHRPATIVMIELEGLDRLVELHGAVRPSTGSCPPSRTRCGATPASPTTSPASGTGRFAVLMPETDEILAINYVERVRRACDLWLESGAVALRMAIGWASSAGGRLAGRRRGPRDRPHVHRAPTGRADVERAGRTARRDPGQRRQRRHGAGLQQLITGGGAGHVPVARPPGPYPERASRRTGFPVRLDPCPRPNGRGLPGGRRRLTHGDRMADASRRGRACGHDPGFRPAPHPPRQRQGDDRADGHDGRADADRRLRARRRTRSASRTSRSTRTRWRGPPPRTRRRSRGSCSWRRTPGPPRSARPRRARRWRSGRRTGPSRCRPGRSPGTSSRYSTVGVTTAAIQASPADSSDHAGDEDRPAADATGEHAGDRRDDGRHRRPRQGPQARLERAQALDDLEELDEEEHGAEDAEVHQERDDVGGA